MERVDLHHRIEKLKKDREEGKLHIAAHLESVFSESFSKIKILEDGLVDPETVDGRIRSLCNVTQHIDDRGKWKQAYSLRELQEGYFNQIFYTFEPFHKLMREGGGNPDHFSNWLSSEEGHVHSTLPILKEFVHNIIDFWQSVSEPTWIHLEDNYDSKAVFGGEIFPHDSSNTSGLTGIYFDTTILPDPFVKMSPLLESMDEATQCYDLLRLGLHMLNYKDLALAEVDKPIIAILPDRHNLEENYQKFILSCSEEDSTKHASYIFGEQFGDFHEFNNFIHQFKTAEEIVKNIKLKKKLLFSTEWEGDLISHINRYIKEAPRAFGKVTPSSAVTLSIISRFSQANDIFQRSKQLGGTPIIQAPTSWHWYNWMLEHNSTQLIDDQLVNLHISRSFQTTVKNEMPWLGNIPDEALIEIRQSGALDEIREIIGLGIQELSHSNPNGIYRSADKVFDNLQEAFDEHEKRIKVLTDKKWKFAGRDLASFLTVGGVELTAALTGLPLYGAIAATVSMSGTIPTAKELKEKYAEIKREENNINSTGVAMLIANKH